MDAKTSGHVTSRERGEEDRKRGEKALKEEIYDLAYKAAGGNVSQETMVFFRRDMGEGRGPLLNLCGLGLYNAYCSLYFLSVFVIWPLLSIIYF